MGNRRPASEETSSQMSWTRHAIDRFDSKGVRDHDGGGARGVSLESHDEGDLSRGTARTVASSSLSELFWGGDSLWLFICRDSVT